MKKFGWLSIVAAMILSACSQSGNYEETIPNESMFLVKMSLGQMVAKSEVMSEPMVSSALREGINSLSADSRDLMREVIDDPETCGLDFSKPVYFALVSAAPSPAGMMTIAVKDQDKLQKFLSTILEEQNFKSMNITLGQHKDAYTLENGNNVYGAFDKTRFVIAMGQNNVDAMEYMSLPSGKKAVNDTKFDEFFSTDNDMVTVYDYAKVIEMNKSVDPESALAKINSKYTDGMMCLSSINFENGAIRSHIGVKYNSAMEELTKNLVQKPSMSHLKLIPSNATLAFVGRAEGIDKILNEVFSDEQKKEISANLGDFNLEDLGSIQGDITFALMPFESNGEYDIKPNLCLYVDCKDRTLFDDIASVFQATEKPELDTDLYPVGNLYFGFQNNLMFLVPADLYSTIFVNGSVQPLDENFTSNRLYSRLEGQYGGLVFDGTTFFQDPALAAFIGKSPIDLNSLLDNITFTSKSQTEGNSDIEFQNKEDNSLKIIKDIVISVLAQQN